ncbi:MAG: hypothetical protein QXD11_01565 [Candidatus Micrarchaeaceae archaeon]
MELKSDSGESHTYTLHAEDSSVPIMGPLVLWLFFLVIALIIEIISLPSLLGSNNIKELRLIAGSILYIPGCIVFPLIVSVWLGERIGRSNENFRQTLKSAIINMLYVIIIYAVVIFIIFVLLDSANISIGNANVSLAENAIASNSIISGMTNINRSFLIYDLLIPSVIIAAITPPFSLLAMLRKKS